MLGVVLVESPDILEQLAVTLIGEALNKPVYSRVEQALILFIGKVLVARLHHVVIQLEHVLDHEE